MKYTESSKQSADAKDPHHGSNKKLTRVPKMTKNERNLLPFESEMVDTTSNSVKRVARSKECHSLHELHESVVHGTPARLLGSRTTKQSLAKGSHAQLSFLNQNRMDGSSKERVSSDYGDDFLDDDFPSLASLVNPHNAQKELFQLPENEFRLNDEMNDGPCPLPIQIGKSHVAPCSGSSNKVTDDNRSENFSSTLEVVKEFWNKPISSRQRSPQFLSDDEIEDDEVAPTPSNQQPMPQHGFPSDLDAVENVNSLHSPRNNDERLFVESSPIVRPGSLDTDSHAESGSTRGPKRRRSSSSYEKCDAKKPKSIHENETRRAPLIVNPSSQNSQPENHRGLNQAKLLEKEQVGPPSQIKSLANQDDGPQNDILSRIPKSWGDMAGIDLSLLAEFADYVDFE